MSSDLIKIVGDSHPKKMIAISETEKSILYIQLAQGRKIFDVMPIDAVESIVDALSNGVSILGSKANTPDLKFAAKEIRLRVLELFPYMTLEEIKEAIRRGSAGDYGEYQGINVLWAMHFIKCFLRNEERLKAIQTKETKALPEPQKVMKVSDWKALILNDYKLLTECNEKVIVFMPKKYALLESLGKIKLTDEQCEEWMWKSKIELENRKTLKAKIKKDKSLLNEIQKISEEFETGEMSETTESKILNNAQRMIYMQFLSEMSKTEFINFFESPQNESTK